MSCGFIGLLVFRKAFFPLWLLPVPDLEFSERMLFVPFDIVILDAVLFGGVNMNNDVYFFFKAVAERQKNFLASVLSNNSDDHHWHVFFGKKAQFRRCSTDRQWTCVSRYSNFSFASFTLHSHSHRPLEEKGPKNAKFVEK